MSDTLATTSATVSADEFEAAWAQAGDYRYDYVLNKGLLVLYGGLLAAFWTYYAITVLSDGFDIGLIVVGLVIAAVSVFVVLTILRWRRFKRLSGVVCEENRILWRTDTQFFVYAWADIDFDTLGLLDVSLATKKYEHYLHFGDAKLALFRPYVRLRNLEVFMGAVLMQLKAHGRLPQNNPVGKKGKKKRKKKGSRADR